MSRRQRIQEDNLTAEDYVANDSIYQEKGVSRNYAHRTKRGLRQTKAKWYLWCQKMQKGDPETCLLDANPSDFRIFMRWVVRNSQIRKQSSLKQEWKRLRLLFKKSARRKISDMVGEDIFNYVQGPLTKERQPDTKPSPKPTMSIEDLSIILHHHWIDDHSIFPIERQRVQLAFIMLFMAYTGSRPGALLEGSDDPGENQGILYQDFKLVLIADPENRAQSKFLLQATLRHLKGRESQEQPSSYTFYERHDLLALCLVTTFLALAFADNAFEANIKTPADLLSKRVPKGLEALTIRWKPTIENTPILRQVEKSHGYHRTSLTKMLTQATYTADISRLGMEAGFPDRVLAYCLRRGVANAIDPVATDAQRNQVLGHGISGSKTYQEHFRSEFISIDVQAIHCGHPSANLLRRAAGLMSLHRDPRAPKQLTEQDYKRLMSSEDIIAMRNRLTSTKAQIRTSYKTIKEAKGTELYTEYNKALQCFQAAVKMRKREALKIKRAIYFRTVGTEELNEQSDATCTDEGMDQLPAVPSYTFHERSNLAYLLFQSTDAAIEPWARIQANRAQVISELASLCSKREIREKPKCAFTKSKPFTKPTPFTKLTALTKSTSLIKTKPSQLDSTPKPDIPQDCDGLAAVVPGKPGEYPLLLPGRICLFCLGDEALAQSARFKDYRRKDVLQNHVERVHLSSLGEESAIRCGHPKCAEVVLEGVMKFKNHAARVHGCCLKSSP